VARFIKIGKRATGSSASASYIYKTRSSSSRICALWKRGKKGKEKERKRREEKKEREKEEERGRGRETKRRGKKRTYECSILLDITIKGKSYLSK
jgi:hypothetical protein